VHRPIPLLLALVMVTLAGAPRVEASLSASRSPASPAAAIRPRARGAEGKGAAREQPAAADKKGRAGERSSHEAQGRAGAKAAREAKPAVAAHSVGHPNDGRLEGGIRLDTSLDQLRVVPAYAGEDIRWGLPALVRMIERAARGVARRYPDAVLDVGDLSRRTGGEVHRHHSHESGRDADIGLYAVDVKGKQVRARSFIQFDARLASVNVPGARFDVGRTWLLVQEMLTDPKARVSHIFIAEPLKRALLAEARRRGVSRAVLVRAQLAMMQPTGAEPHDDHMHVRISCPRGASGCIELAKNAPSARDRARAGRGAKALRTPGRGAPQRGAGAPAAVKITE
jgi:penicillin-insensitive murein endopeptidase